MNIIGLSEPQDVGFVAAELGSLPVFAANGLRGAALTKHLLPRTPDVDVWGIRVGDSRGWVSDVLVSGASRAADGDRFVTDAYIRETRSGHPRLAADMTPPQGLRKGCILQLTPTPGEEGGVGYSGDVISYTKLGPQFGPSPFLPLAVGWLDGAYLLPQLVAVLRTGVVGRVFATGKGLGSRGSLYYYFDGLVLWIQTKAERLTGPMPPRLEEPSAPAVTHGGAWESDIAA